MSVVDIKAPQEFDTLEVLAAAVAIFEFNKGYHKQSENIILEDNTTKIRYANREILRSQFLVDYYSGNKKPPLVKVYDRHREEAEKIRVQVENLQGQRDSHGKSLLQVEGEGIGSIESQPNRTPVFAG